MDIHTLDSMAQEVEINIVYRFDFLLPMVVVAEEFVHAMYLCWKWRCYWWKVGTHEAHLTFESMEICLLEEENRICYPSKI